MTEPAEVRKTPCASCPYRCSVPSWIWHPDEYAKLTQYDLPMHEQPLAVFHCHQGSGDICAGWAGHRDPLDLFALRVGIIDGRVSPDAAEYTTDVPLFASGQAAAEHGVESIEHPGAESIEAIRKIVRVRAAAGDPVRD